MPDARRVLLRLETLGEQAAGMVNSRAPTEPAADASQRGGLAAAGQTRQPGNLRHSCARRELAT
jgi:hypothetical protein